MVIGVTAFRMERSAIVATALGAIIGALNNRFVLPDISHADKKVVKSSVILLAVIYG